MYMRILDTNRKKYRRIFTNSKECVFCKKKETLECLGLAGQYWRVFVNQFPYMDGNVMIVPTVHREKIEEITKEEWQDFGSVLTKTQTILGKIFKTRSFNVGLNIGSESGASIPHLHWQIIPRKFKNVTVMNTFADLYIVAMSPKEMKKLIDREMKTTKKSR